MKTTHTRVQFRLRPLSFGIALAHCSTPLLAQDNQAEPVVLEPVVIESATEAQTLPGSDTIPAESLRRLRAATSDAASLLRDVPGVSLNAAGGVSSLPAIHGLADDRLRIRVDGMDLIASCPNHMNPPLSYLDPSNLGRLQVFAGISPVSLGGDSIGGTIVADSIAPEFASLDQERLSKGELGTFYRSNNNGYGGNASATFASQAVSINYSGSYSQADNYTAGGDFKTTTATGRPGHQLPLDEVGSTAYETQNHRLGFAYKTGENLFDAAVGYQQIDEQLYPNQRMDMLDNTQKSINLRWLGGFDWGSLEARVYHEAVDHMMDFGEDKRFWYGPESQPPAAGEPGTPCSPIGFMTCASGMPMYSEGKTTGARLKADIDLTPDNLLRVGGEYQRYRLDDYWKPSGGGMWPDTFLNINDGERDRAAFFTEWESQLSDRWLTLLGARYERVRTDAGDVHGYKSDMPAPGNQIADAAAFNSRDHDKSDDNWDIAALARYSLDANLDVEMGVAQKTRSPNLYERYTWSTWSMPAVMNNFVGDGNGYVGDIDLKPERARTVSATLDWHAENRSWELKVTPYYTYVDDYIDAVALPGWAPDQFNVLQYANQSARLYGVDVSGQMPIGSNAWGTWGLKGLLNYTDGENRDTGDSLYNIMPLNAKLTITQEIDGWDNAIELVMVDGKDDLSGVRNEIETGSYNLVNLRASHSWDRVRIDLGIENLFDTYYELPTGGAYTGQGSTMQLNAIPWGIAVPGMGRSLYAGVNLTF